MWVDTIPPLLDVGTDDTPSLADLIALARVSVTIDYEDMDPTDPRTLVTFIDAHGRRTSRLMSRVRATALMRWLSEGHASRRVSGF